jgi:glyoxylase-like metal-dependent hydrolase (beta-lactamase superfamily II)
MTEQLVRMESPIAGLYASAPAPLPFAPKTHVRAFLLRRSRGNVLIYTSRGLDAAALREIGGASRRYLNHHHEALFGTDDVDAPLFVHERDRAAVEPKLHVRGTFSRRHMLDEDFEVIPTPGHTPGATAFLWDSGEHRFLFTGDTIYLADGEWVAAVLESSDRDAYIASLELLRGLDFDVLVPWAASAGRPYHAVTSNADARRRIDAIVERLRRGENR